MRSQFTSSTELFVDFGIGCNDLRYFFDMNDSNQSRMNMDIHRSNFDNTDSCRRSIVSHVYTQIYN